MQMSQLLAPEAVKVLAQISSKKRLFQELGELAQHAHGICNSRSFDALQERESLGPTGVGHGVALPHARLDGLDHVVGVFIRLEKPLAFDAVDRQPVDLIFGLFAPVEAGVDHLKSLALVSRTLRDPNMCEKLRSNEDATTLYTILTQGQTSVAA